MFPVKIAEDYFYRLLHSKDPLTAVYDLDRCCCTRPGRTVSQPQFGLSQPEFNVHMYLLYQGEIGNGGHCRFFLNPAGGYAPEVLEALERLRFEPIREILLRAIALFPNAEVPRNPTEREALVTHMTKDNLMLWGRLDREFYAIDGGYWGRLLEYLQEHAEEILRPERSQ